MVDFSTTVSIQKWLIVLFVALTPLGGLFIIWDHKTIAGLHLAIATSPGTRPYREIPRMPMLHFIGDERQIVLKVDSELRAQASGPHRRQLFYWIHFYDLAAQKRREGPDHPITKTFADHVCNKHGRSIFRSPQLDFEVKKVRILSEGKPVFEVEC